MKKFCILMMSAIAALAACEKSGDKTDNGDNGGNKEPSSKEHVIGAKISSAFKSADGATEVKPEWLDEAELELYTEGETYVYTMSEQGKFKSEIMPEGEILYAAYPGQNAVYSAAGLTVSLPSEIDYNEEGKVFVPLVANVGKTTGELSDLELTAPLGLIKISYTGVPTGYNALVVTSAGMRVSGTFKYENGVLSSTATTSPNVTRINFETLTEVKDMSFYVPVPVGTFESIDFKLTGDGVKDIMVADMQNQKIDKTVLYTLSVRQDLKIAWGEIAEEKLIFPYTGESRDFPVVSNTEWTVVSSNPEIIAEKKNATTVTVTVPQGKYLGGICSEIKLVSANSGDIVAPAIMEVTQENSTLFVNPSGDVRYNKDGSATFSVHPADGDMTEVKRSSLGVPADFRPKFGTYTFDFTEMNLAGVGGFFHMENWLGGNGNFQLQFGGYDRIYFAVKNTEYASGTSFSFHGNMPADLTAIKQIVLKIFPIPSAEGIENDDMIMELYVDGAKLLEQKIGTNIWKEESSAGMNITFGITYRDGGLVPAHFTMKSFTYSEEY